MSARDSSDLNFNTLMWVGIAGAAAYILYKVSKAGGAVVGAVTAGASDAIASAWLAATLPEQMSVLGNVVFPDIVGTDGKPLQIPLNTLQVRQTQSGDVQTTYGGKIYQLQQSDLNGNWPAVLVQ